jgi:general stress protein YciG
MAAKGRKGRLSTNGKQRLGFAAMSPEKRRAIAAQGGLRAASPEKRKELSRLGGLASHAQGVGHEFTSAEAKIAGRKGGQIVSRDRAYLQRWDVRVERPRKLRSTVRGEMPSGKLCRRRGFPFLPR